MVRCFTDSTVRRIFPIGGVVSRFKVYFTSKPGDLAILLLLCFALVFLGVFEKKLHTQKVICGTRA